MEETIKSLDQLLLDKNVIEVYGNLESPIMRVDLNEACVGYGNYIYFYPNGPAVNLSPIEKLSKFKEWVTPEKYVEGLVSYIKSKDREVEVIEKEYDKSIEDSYTNSRYKMKILAEGAVDMVGSPLVTIAVLSIAVVNKIRNVFGKDDYDI